MSTTTIETPHRFEPATQPGLPPLLLLHGTGGDEADLLPLGRMVAPGASLLSPRGAVLEHGMPRFFRRLSEGVFDEDDLRHRTDDLAAFIGRARAVHGLAGTPVLLLSGADDPIVPAENSARLAAQLSAAGAAVTHRSLPLGHGLSQMDVTLARDWIAALPAGESA